MKSHGSQLAMIVCIVVVASGCGVTARTYQGQRLNRAFPYVWMLRTQGGQVISFYDLRRLEVTDDSIHVVSGGIRHHICLEDIKSLDRVKTTKDIGHSAALGVLGAVIGAIVGGAATYQKVKEGPKEAYFELNANLSFVPGAVVGLVGGAMIGVALGDRLERSAAQSSTDFSGLSGSEIAYRLRRMQSQFSASKPRHLRIEKKDGSVVDGRIIEWKEKEYIILDTMTGRVTISWDEIHSY